MKTIVGRDPKTHLVTYDFSAYADAIPAAWLRPLSDYFNAGIAPGKFIRAVLENDFIGAVRRLNPAVHQEPIAILFAITELLIEGAPSGAHGSPAKVAAWLELWQPEGLYGRAQAAALVAQAQTENANRKPLPQPALLEAPTNYGKD
jgi:hypothetical protein